jgi:hypothetical protein
MGNGAAVRFLAYRQNRLRSTVVSGISAGHTFVENSATPIRFTAEVATVSDEGLENENPAMLLSMALTRLKQKYKLPGSTHYSIKGEATGPHYRNRKMRLRLPLGAEIEKMLEKHVAPMFKRV